MVHSALAVHIIYRLAMGGLENELVNLINHMPSGRYWHVLLCLTDFADFRERLCSHVVSARALHKKPGRDWSAYGRLWNIIWDLKPTIVHTRNLPNIGKGQRWRRARSLLYSWRTWTSSALSVWSQPKVPHLAKNAS